MSTFKISWKILIIDKNNTTSPVLVNDVRAVLTLLPDLKVAGIYGIATEIWQATKEASVKILIKIFKQI